MKLMHLFILCFLMLILFPVTSFSQDEKKINKIDEAKAFLEEASKSDFTVKKVETKPGKRSPSAPFTTSTIQQEASRKLGFPVARTMSVAQKLYEA